MENRGQDNQNGNAGYDASRNSYSRGGQDRGGYKGGSGGRGYDNNRGFNGAQRSGAPHDN